MLVCAVHTLFQEEVSKERDDLGRVWYICTYVCMCMYICVCTYMYVCMYVCIYTYVYIRMYVCMYVCEHTCTYVYVCTYMSSWPSHDCHVTPCRDWLDGQPGLISSVMYTYLSLLPCHAFPALSNLRDQETQLCLSLIRTRVRVGNN